METPSYWHKPTKAEFEQIFWNIPEQKSGTILNLGGNSQNFAGVIKNSEVLASLHLKTITTLLPDALQHKLPPLLGIHFAPSTNTGSFADTQLAKEPLISLDQAVKSVDLTLLSGDFSKNSATAIALSKLLKDHPDKQFVLAKDSIDLIASDAESIISSPGVVIIASIPQLQKLLRAIFYPKMLLLSMPLLPVVELLHKFTLSFSCTIVTLSSGQIITAKDGTVYTIPLEKTSYSPLSFFTGSLASYIAAMNVWNPKSSLATTAAAIFYK